MTDKNKPGMGFAVNIDKGASLDKRTDGHITTDNTELAAGADTPFCIAVLGALSGTASQAKPLSARKIIEIDRDNFESVMASLDIELNLDIGGEQVEIKISELDDFHPDELYDKVDSFSKLRSLKRRLKNNNTFAEAAAEIQSWYPDTVVSQVDTVETSDASEKNAPPTENLLDTILGSPEQKQMLESDAETAHINKLIRSIVAPYVEPAADPRQDELIAMVDHATEMHMRDILHHEEFQAIESAWQSLYFLTRRLETSSKLKINLLDISQAEMAGDLAVEDLSQSVLYKKFCDAGEGDTPWSILLGNYTFSDNIEDALTLANMGAIAQKAGATFMSAANEKLVGCESFSSAAEFEDWSYTMKNGVVEAWTLLRQSPVAKHIALALPRFLLRVPYGKRGKPVDAFKFDEMPESHCHECYLWGNAAFLKVEMIARNFLVSGWNLHPAQVYQTSGLPVAYFEDEGEVVAKPVAEISLTERGGEQISQHGFISMWSVRNEDAVRSSDYRSISEAGEEMAGRWK